MSTIGEIGELTLGVVPGLDKLGGLMASGVKKAGEDGGKSLGESFGSNVLSTVKKFAAPIAAALTVGALVKFAKSTVEAYEGVTKAAIATQRQLGGTIDAASKLNFAFRETGVNSATAATGLKNFERFAQNSKDTTKLLGFAVKDSNGHVKDMGVLLPELADKFKGMNDGATKTALAVKLFGRSGTDLLPFLNKGSAGIAALTAKATAFGFVVGDENVAAVQKSIAVHREWGLALEGLKITIGERLAPVIEKIFLPVLEGLTTWIVQKGIPLVNQIADAMTKWVKAHAEDFRKAWVDIQLAVGKAYDFLKTVYTFIQDNFTPKQQKDFLEIVAAIAVLKKTGVFSVGVKIIGAAASLLQGGTVNLGATAMQSAADTMLLAAGTMKESAREMGAGEAAKKLSVGIAGKAGDVAFDPSAAALTTKEVHKSILESDKFGGKGAVALAGLSLPEIAVIVAGVVATFFDVKFGIKAGTAKGAAAGQPFAKEIADTKAHPSVTSVGKLGLELSPVGIGAFEITRLVDSGEWSKLYESFMNNYGSKIAKFFKVDAKNAVTDGLNFITNQWNTFSHFIATSFDTWWQTHGAAVKQIWGNLSVAAKKLADDIKAFLTGPELSILWQGFWTSFKDVAILAWAVVKGVVQAGWNFLVLTFNLAKTTLVFIAKTIWDGIVAVFSIAIDILTGHWHQAWIDLTTFFRQTWNNAKDFLVGILGSLGQFFANFWNNSLKPILLSIGSFVVNELVNSFRTAVGLIGSIWDRLRGYISAPIQWAITGFINPLIDGFDKLANALGAKVFIPLIGLGGGATQGQAFYQYAAGGRVFGPGGPRDDLIPALLSNGEYIIPTAVVEAFGVSFFDNLIHNRRRSQYPGDGSNGGFAYASGGLVGGIFSDIWSALVDPARLITGPLRSLLNGVPGTGVVTTILRAMGDKLIGGLLTWLNSAGGAGPVGKTQAFIRSQAGKPYGWAMAGPSAYDCSGIVSAAWLMMHGKSPYNHLFSTIDEAPYFPKSGTGLFTAGWAQGGERGGGSVGHTAATLAGLTFESTGSRGVHITNVTPLGNFAHLGHYDMGGAWPSGTLGINTSGRTEHVINAPTMDTLVALLQKVVAAVERVAPGVGAEINRSGRAMVRIARTT